MPANPYSSLYPNVPLPTQQTDPRQFAGSVISNYVKPTLPQGFGADANTTNPDAWHSMWQMLRQSPDFRFHMPGMDQIGQTLKANPNYQTYGPSHPSPKRPGLLSRVTGGAEQFGRDVRRGTAGYGARRYVWPVAAGAVGGGFATGALGAGGGAGAGAGAGGGVAGSAAVGGGSVAGAAGGVGAAAGGGAAMGAGGGMAAGGGNSMWPLLVSEGGSLLSGYMNKRATDKARNQQQHNIQNALAQLTPEAIQQLMRLFYTQNYAQMMPQMQGAQQGLAANAGRHGLTGSGVAQQLAAGIPGQFAQNALQSAQGEALGVAGQRASTLAGAPVTMPYSAGGDIQNMLSILSMYGLLKNNKPAATQPANQNSNPWWIEGPGHRTVET